MDSASPARKTSTLSVPKSKYFGSILGLQRRKVGCLGNILEENVPLTSDIPAYQGDSFAQKNM
eukprot:3245742-Pleurochrysis_carterae.AAC.3